MLGISQKVQDKIQEIVYKFDKIAIFAGSMQEGRDLEEIICDCERMNLALILCGPKISERLAEKINLHANVFYLGNLNESDLAYVYGNVCVGYVNYSNKPLNTKYCAPVKIWEYRMRGLYIFSNHNYAMKNEWSDLVDRFYGMPDPASDSVLHEDIFSRPPVGLTVRTFENMLSSVAAE